MKIDPNCERIEFKTNQGRQFYFGNQSVVTATHLSLPDKAAIIGFAGDIS